MKLLIDAQLPGRLARELVALGHDAIHTGELPGGNAATDQAISELADREDRVVVTKDSDFRNSHLLTNSPRRLLVVATGNISNSLLLALFEDHLHAIEQAFRGHEYVEIHRSALILHPRRDHAQ